MNLEFINQVNVLTTGYWPSYKSFKVQIPKEIEICIDQFAQFYKKKTNHRNLNWCFSHGTAVILANFESKSYDLVTSTYQACILVLFNEEKTTLTYQQIKDAMNFDDETAKRQLHSLSCVSKYAILEKTPASKSINLEDSFSINETFTSQLKKVKLPLPALEEFFSKEKVIEDRSIAIEAAIVRIMKSRKQLEHNALVQEVITQLQTFKPHPKVNKDWVNL